MGTWAELGRDVIFGAVTLLVAFNYRDVACRIHGFMANTVGVDRLLTPTTVRVTFGLLATMPIADIAVGVAQR